MFNIYHFYKNELNLYGDNGNVLYLQHFLELFGIDSQVTVIDRNTTNLAECDFIFAGGGPDLQQDSIFKDFLLKKDFLKRHIEAGKPSLFICGSFQLLGKYYLTATKEKIPGLDLFDFYTYSPKDQKHRIVGNIKSKLNSPTKFFTKNQVVGFENHNGRTILNKLEPFTVVDNLNCGNNDVDYTEGLLYKKTIGTYFHGPLLVKNPHILSFLLEKYLPKIELDPRVFSTEFITFKNALNKSR